MGSAIDLGVNRPKRGAVYNSGLHNASGPFSAFVGGPYQQNSWGRMNFLWLAIAEENLVDADH